ncbi:TPA: 50S ribosomal protein L9 [bacterium]|nr:50S ribosomal protein L9 [bacterium]
MKVILLEEIEGKGKPGDILELSSGFVRNFILPKKLAILATDKNLKLIKEIKEREEKRKEEERKKKEALKERLEGLVITIKKKAGSDDRMFGQVTSEDIKTSLLSYDIEIDKKDIALSDIGIKALGEHQVVVKLGYDIKANLKVIVEKEE